MTAKTHYLHSPVRWLLPDLKVSRVLDLTPGCLQLLELDALLLDIDNTLKPYRATQFDLEVKAWVTSLRTAGIGLFLFSNGRQNRVAALAQKLEVPFIADARKPLPMRCTKALRRFSLNPARTGLVGDQIFADILAGRLAGLFTILADPINTDEPWFTRIKRPLERIVMRWALRHALIEKDPE